MAVCCLEALICRACMLLSSRAAPCMLLACHLGEPSRVAGLGEREEQPSCMCEHVFVVLLLGSCLLVGRLQSSSSSSSPARWDRRETDPRSEQKPMAVKPKRLRGTRTLRTTWWGTLSKSSYKHPNPAELFPHAAATGRHHQNSEAQESTSRPFDQTGTRQAAVVVQQVHLDDPATSWCACLSCRSGPFRLNRR